MAFIEDLNHRVCDALWVMRTEGDKAGGSTGGATNILWPRYRGENGTVAGPRRLSEQEARFAMAVLLSNEPSRSFSVETPTLKTYAFTGKTEMSAQTDLTIFRVSSGGEFERDINVEFKAHQPDQSSVDKDFEKLLREPVDGIWFHVLENSDRGTLPTLFAKFKAAAKNRQGKALSSEHKIHFCVCRVGRPGWACSLSVDKARLVAPSSTIFDIARTDRPGPALDGTLRALGWEIWP